MLLLPSSMDTLSSSVSSLKVPSLPATNREFGHFKSTPCAATNCFPPPQAHVSSSSISNLLPKTKSNPFSQKGSTSIIFSSETSRLNPSSPLFYRNPAAGYAAAVIDVAQSNNSLHLVQNDVQRLLKFLQNVNFQSSLVDPSLMEELKGQALRQAVEQGKIHRHLVALLKMLIKKNMVGIVQEVLEEFERIYDELCGTQVALVTSTKKMGEDQLFGIAKSVQRLSGAARVKVRNLVHESSPSYAL